MLVVDQLQVLPRFALVDDRLLLVGLLHPVLVQNPLEQPLHLLLEFLVDRLGADARLDLLDDFVEEAHDEVVVLPALPKLEADCGVEEVVVEGLVGVIDFSDCIVYIPIDLLGLSDGVLGHFVLQ